MDNIEILEKYIKMKCPVVFIADSPEYAIDAFFYDYILLKNGLAR